MLAPLPRTDAVRNAVRLEHRSPEILEKITSPATDLAVWRRTLPAELSHWLEKETPELLPGGRILVRLSQLQDAVGALVRNGGAMTGPRQFLAQDIIDLSRRFAAIAKTDQVDIRLDVIQRDACWRFHRDASTLRLLTTYRGPATQIPPVRFVAKALKEQRDYRGPLKELPHHSVAIFRGDPDDSGRGVLHRSPPVAGTGITRLLLCLNLPSGASPKAWKKKVA